MDRYQIRVRGQIDPQWSDWLSGMEITAEDDEPTLTVLEGAVPDQAALRGILNRLWDLNLGLVAVNLLEEEKTDERKSQKENQEARHDSQ